VFRENADVLARIVVFVLPLGLDTLAISIALGLQGHRPLRPALLFVAFETTMPLIGIIIGRVIGFWFETPAAYLGGLILIGVGLHTMREARHLDNQARRADLEIVELLARAKAARRMRSPGLSMLKGVAYVLSPSTRIGTLLRADRFCNYLQSTLLRHMACAQARF
jgi:putative manganese efflux pump